MTTDERLLFTVHEAANALSLSRATVYKLIANGELASVTIGRSRRVTKQQLVSPVLAATERKGRFFAIGQDASEPGTRARRCCGEGHLNIDEAARCWNASPNSVNFHIEAREGS